MSRRTFGTIRRLPSGRWRARFTDHNGRQKAAPQTFTTKAEAGRWLSRTQSEMERGQFVDPKMGKELLSDYAALWLSTRLVRGRPLSPRTLELYRWQLRKHILPTLGKTQLRHLGTTRSPRMVRPNQRSRRTRSTNRCQVLQTPQGHHADRHGGRAGGKEPLFHPQCGP